ncbi:MAG: hypothetical protein EPO22_12050 [Dehalococcoidia bacterium]|nr:MAG: hypothetical protein EPO22_12050 [Dehalococcoidia bacterium]
MELVVAIYPRTPVTLPDPSGRPLQIDGVAYAPAVVDASGRLISAGMAPVVTPKPAAAIGLQAIAVPAGAAWEIVTLHVLYQATATAGDRNFTVEFKDAPGGNLLYQAIDATVIVAGAGRGIWGAGGGAHGTTAGGPFSQDMMQLPSKLITPAGGEISFRDAANIDPADTIAVTLVALPV